MSREYITDHGCCSVGELPQLAAGFETEQTAAYAVWTDRFSCTRHFSGEDPAHLQELRIFDENRELRARRQGDHFLWRLIDDNAFREALAGEPDAFLADFGNRTYTEKQYLDVDTDKSSGTDYVTTGGGHYTLPEEGLKYLVLRNYLDYDENGILQAADFRLVRFEEEV